MSKTLGNVIDPIDTIKEYGTDALRFTLSLGTAGQVCLEFGVAVYCLMNICDLCLCGCILLLSIYLHSCRTSICPLRD